MTRIRTVTNTTALAAIAASDREDGQVVLDESTLSNWEFDASSSASASAIVVVPNADTGRWLKQLGDVVNAAETGLSAANTRAQNAAALKAALDVSGGVVEVTVAGTYPIDTVTASTGAPVYLRVADGVIFDGESTTTDFLVSDGPRVVVIGGRYENFSNNAFTMATEDIDTFDVLYFSRIEVEACGRGVYYPCHVLDGCVTDSKFNNLTRANGCNAIWMGTNVSAGDDTGRLVAQNNQIDGVVTQPGGTGETHGVILYGRYAEVVANTIKNVEGPAGFNNNGIEAIYTKSKSAAVVFNNIIGLANGEGVITVKGTTDDVTSPLGRDNLIAFNYIEGGSAEKEPNAAISVHITSSIVAYNRVVDFYGRFIIHLNPSVVDCKIENNVCRSVRVSSFCNFDQYSPGVVRICNNEIRDWLLNASNSPNFVLGPLLSQTQNGGDQSAGRLIVESNHIDMSENTRTFNYVAYLNLFNTLKTPWISIERNNVTWGASATARRVVQLLLGSGSATVGRLTIGENTADVAPSAMLTKSGAAAASIADGATVLAANGWDNVLGQVIDASAGDVTGAAGNIVASMAFGKVYHVKLEETTALDGDTNKSFSLGDGTTADEFMAAVTADGSAVGYAVVDGTANVGLPLRVTVTNNASASAGVVTATVVVK